MCGISGIFDLVGRRDFSVDLVSGFNNIQAHRGPDACGIYQDSSHCSMLIFRWGLCLMGKFITIVS